MSIGTMIRLILILPITLAACIQMGAGEEGFKSSDRAYMQELEIALKDAGIEFRTDPDGMITYKHRDSQKVDAMRAEVCKRMRGGEAVKFEEPEENDYFRSLLESLDLEYGVEPRDDGDWTRWYPADESQSRELKMTVVQHSFARQAEELWKIPCENEQGRGHRKGLVQASSNQGVEGKRAPC